MLDDPKLPKVEEDDPKPVEVGLFALLPDELDPKGDEYDDDDPWLLEPWLLDEEEP